MLIAQDVALSSATTGVIEAYQGTKEPRLPDPEGWEAARLARVGGAGPHEVA